jgi:hypothetical protein
MGLPFRSGLQRLFPAVAAGGLIWLVYILAGPTGTAHGGAVAIASAAILVAYATFLLWITFGPRRPRGYDRQLSVWLTGLVLCCLGVLGVLLTVGVYFRLGILVTGVAFFTVVPACIGIPPIVYEAFRKWQKKREQRDRPIPADELFNRLAGQTHVIERVSPEPEHRRWRELRYYAADGRMPGFKEEDGRVEPYPAAVTWRIRDGFLETVSSLTPEKTTRYRLMTRVDGQIAYYFHEPGSQLHGLCGFYTIEIRTGEPQPTPANQPA